VDPKLAREFVYGPTVQERPPAGVTTVPKLHRVPLSTRIRSDYAEALKRASLERQLAGTEPSTLIDMLEQALEPWLKANGYLP
jgi:hypothetical protein